MMLAEVIQHSRVKEFAGSEDGYLADALAPFVQFCKSNGQKYCPTTPDVVAAYVTALALFQSEQTITDALRAIELLHDQFGYRTLWLAVAVRKALVQDCCIRSAAILDERRQANFQNRIAAADGNHYQTRGRARQSTSAGTVQA